MPDVVCWNLFHGRADPPAGRPLLHEFATTLAAWSWDVALLQEVPPWWPPLLARACGAEERTARTSRNALLPLRRAVAARRPDLLRSNGGGANAILVRPPLRITAHARRRLRSWPERRVVHAVRVRDDAGVERWIGNLHGQKGVWDDGPGLVRPLADLERSVARMRAWAATAGGAEDDGPPLLLGGDLNLPREAVAAALPADWARIASSGPDHVVGREVVALGDSTRPRRGALSDHAALAIAVGERR